MADKRLLKPILLINTVTNRRKRLPTAYHALTQILDSDPPRDFDIDKFLGDLAELQEPENRLSRPSVGKYTFAPNGDYLRGQHAIKPLFVLNGETGEVQKALGIRAAGVICKCNSVSVSNACDVDRVVAKKYFICSSQKNAERQYAAVKERGSLKKPPGAKPINERTALKERKLISIQISYEGVVTHTATGIADAADFLDCSHETVRESMYKNRARLFGHVLTPIYEPAKLA